jgi:hypothetical protein
MRGNLVKPRKRESAKAGFRQKVRKDDKDWKQMPPFGHLITP